MNRQSIEEIEQDYWRTPGADASGLIKRVYLARKKIIDELSVEDLRLLVGQDVSLSITIPLAIQALKENLFAEGDYYPGDLLKSVLTIDPQFWTSNLALKNQVEKLCRNLGSITQHNIDIPGNIEREIIKAVADFLKQ